MAILAFKIDANEIEENPKKNIRTGEIVLDHVTFVESARVRPVDEGCDEVHRVSEG